MIKTYLFSSFFVLACSVGLAQTNKITDSLKHELSIAKEDTSRVNIMVYLCTVYRLYNSDSSLLYGQQAAALANKINYPRGAVVALGFESMILNQMGNLPASLQKGLKALQIAAENKMELLTTPALDAVGGVYGTLGDYKKALYYFHRMLIEGRKNADKIGLAYAEADLGNVFVELNRLDSAAYYLNNAERDFRLVGRLEPLTYISLGLVEMKSGKHDAAMDYYQKSLQIAAANNEPRAISRVYYNLSKFYLQLNQKDSAVYYAKKGLAIAEQLSLQGLILPCANLLSQLYEPIDAKESLAFYKIAAAAKDSLYGAGNIAAIQAIANQEQERQKEIVATKIAYQNKLKQYAFLAGLGVLMIIAFILYRNNRQKQKANKVLETTLSNLKSTQSQLIQSEKMASLGELTAGIAHEIQNPLNFVNNFSDVNKELLAEMNEEIDKGNIEEVKAIAKDVFDNEEKINHHGKRAEAIVKGMLQHSQASTGKKEPTSINALADEYLRLAYHGLKAKDKDFNADIKTDFDNSIGNINIIPQDIGRVLLNLYNNALYAVNEKLRLALHDSHYVPTVEVSTKKEGNKVLISVKDNGNGIPQKIIDKIFQPFFTTKPTGQGTGLGLSMSYDIVKAHGGELKVETKEEDGATFIIQLQITS